MSESTQTESSAPSHTGRERAPVTAPTEEFLLLYSSRPAIELLVAIGFLILLVVLRWRGVAAIDAAFIGGAEGDAGFYVWLLKTHARDLFSQHWFQTGAFYPYGTTLAWSDNFILPGFLALPLIRSGVSTEVAYNSILLLAQFLNSYCTYRLCFRLGGQYFSAITAGAAFMSLSYLTLHLGHPQNQFAFWFPLALLALFRFSATRGFFPALAFGAVLFLSFLTTVYFTVFVAILAVVFWGAFFLLRPHALRWRDVKVFCAGAACGAAPVIFFAWPYLGTSSVFGDRQLYESYYFAATALSYLSSTPFNFIYGITAGWSHTEANFFPGIAVLALAFLAFRRLCEAKQLKRISRITIGLFIISAACSAAMHLNPALKYLCALFLWASLVMLAVLLYRMARLERTLGFNIMTNRALISIFTALAAVFYALSLGPLGNPERGHLPLGVFSLFHSIFPGADGIRAVARFGIVCDFALIVLAGFALNLLRDKKLVNPKWFALVPLAILLENYTPLYPLESLEPQSSAFDYLQQIPRSEEAVAVLPMTGELNTDGTVKSWGEFARMNVTYMHWAFPLQRRLINGYSGYRTKIMREYPALLAGFPDERSIAALSHIAGLRYIIVASRFIPGFDKTALSLRAEKIGVRLHFILSDPAGNYLFELTGPHKITDDFYLLAPSAPAGDLNFELLAVKQAGDPPVEVEIFQLDGEKRLPLGAIRVTADGQQATAHIALPRGDDGVRPIKIAFNVHGDHTVLLNRSRFEPK